MTHSQRSYSSLVFPVEWLSPPIAMHLYCESACGGGSHARLARYATVCVWASSQGETRSELVREECWRERAYEHGGL